MAIPRFRPPKRHRLCATIAELASAMGMAKRTLENWNVEGRLPVENGKYSTRKLCAMLEELQDAEAERKRASDDAEDWDTRKKAADAQRREIELARMKLDLLTDASVREAFASVFGVVCNGLATLPARIAPVLEGQQREEIERILDAELRSIMGDAERIAETTRLRRPE